MRLKEGLVTYPLPDSTTPRLDLELLLVQALQQPRSFVYANPDYELSPEQERVFQNLYQRRLQGEPIAYIIGKKEFWSLELTVNEKVLIPRPETELLIEIILQLYPAKLGSPSYGVPQPGGQTGPAGCGIPLFETFTVADLGTGSGAIALALAKEHPEWRITATDISQEALEVARYNAKQLGMQNVVFCGGDWCEALPDQQYNLIVSNPPYVAEHDPHLSDGDIRFEPKIALTSGNGLAAIEKIVTQAKTKLKNGGLLVLEHGYDQSGAVQQLLKKNSYYDIVPYRDLANIYRAVVARI